MTENVTNPTTRSRRSLRWTLVSVIAVLASMLVSVAPASAGGTISFDGAGWGHGVGMSQYGAYGRALDGQQYKNNGSNTGILESYYTGATVGQLGVDVTDTGELFVSVGSDRTSTTVSVCDTDLDCGGGATPGDGVVVTRRTGGGSEPTVVMYSGDDVVVTDTTPDAGDEDGCEFTFSIDGSEVVWAAGECDADFALAGTGSAPTNIVKATNCRTSNCSFGYGENFKLVDNGSAQRDKKDTTGGLAWPGFDLVVQIDVNEYTLGILEVPFSWPEHALKTQAVAARSFAASLDYALDHKDQGCFCDLKNDSSAQVYAGWTGNRYLYDAWEAAVTQTDNEVVVHPDSPHGDIVRAYYASSNGGASEWVKEKWGSDFSFLVSVDDPWSLVSANPRADWTFTFSDDAIVDAVWGTSSTLKLIDAEVIARNVSGSAKTIRFTGRIPGGSTTTKDLSVGSVTSAFSLYSWYFDVDISDLIFEFADIDGNTHAVDIEYLASLGVALPCDDGPDLFCPNDRMRREDLAAFMVGALGLPATSTDYFVDDDGLPHEDAINSLAEAGITKGCNPPANDRFCPDSTVSRGQTAAFIVRGWALTDPGPGDWFVDDDGDTFENDIDRLANAGVTKGCNPPSNTWYCPDRLLSRGEMSSFLARALRDLVAP